MTTSGHTAEQIDAEGEFWRRYYELRGTRAVSAEAALVLADHCEQHGHHDMAADWRTGCLHLGSSDDPAPDLEVEPCWRCGLYYVDE